MPYITQNDNEFNVLPVFRFFKCGGCTKMHIEFGWLIWVAGITV